MAVPTRYNLLGDLTSIYFGQDADILFGETAEEIIAILREILDR